MAYEIPQQLEYKEKIIFNLTFKQLAYALGFGILSFLAYKKIDTNSIKYIATTIPLLAGAGFIFFNADKYLKDYKNFLTFRKSTLLDEKQTKFIGIENIEKHKAKITQNKDRYNISAIKVKPINFMMKNSREQEVIIKNFQKFLNSLDFPIQILMTTDSLNLDVYLNQLEQKIENSKNKHHEKIFTSYREHLNNIIQETNMMDRSFYIIIPEKGNLEAQIHVVKEKLNSAGLKNELQNSTQLKNIFSRFFNNLMEDDDKSQLAKGKLRKDNLFQYDIQPKLMKNKPNYFQINSQANRIIHATGYPRTVELGFLDKIITARGNFDISIHIEPYDIETTMLNLNKELQKQSADLYAQKTKEIINPSLEIQYNDTKNTLSNLQKGTEKLFNVSLYINCKANYMNELELLSKKVESDLNSVLITPKQPLFRMSQGIKSVMPIARNELDTKRNITTEALSAFFPFTSQFLDIDKEGIWLGQNSNNIPIIKDIFKLTNPNGCILASSGAGKSYTAKLMIARHLLNQTKAIIIDPQNEYTELARRFNGQIVNISRYSKTIINPLDLMGHDYSEKRLALIDLFNIMLGGTSEIQKAVLDKALTRTYEKKGIHENKKTWNKEPPILADLLYELEIMSKKATIVEKETYRSIINRLSMYTTGVFSFLNRQTNIDFKNRFVCFNIGDMPKQVKPVIMFLILDYVYMKMKKDKDKKLLVIDESWSLLQNQEEDSYIFEIVKTCRKFNLGLLLITQDVDDLLESSSGKALLNNSSYTLLLRQKPSIIDNIGSTFRLSRNEKDILLTANRGEGILICENEHSKIRVTASKEEDDIITTEPKPIVEPETNEEEPQPTQPLETIDTEKGLFLKKDLSDEEIDLLLRKGYIISSHVPLGGGQRYDYLMKPNAGESASHFFLVKAIEEYIRNFTNDIKLYETKKPDIVFRANKKKWAFEIETGATIKKNPPQFFNKLELLKKDYKKDWLFVVTKSEDAYSYNRYGKTYTRKNIEKKIRSIFSDIIPPKNRPKKQSILGEEKKKRKAKSSSKKSKKKK